MIVDSLSYLNSYVWNNFIRLNKLRRDNGVQKAFIYDYLVNLCLRNFLPYLYYYLPAMHGGFANECVILCFHGTEDKLIPIDEKRHDYTDV